MTTKATIDDISLFLPRETFENNLVTLSIIHQAQQKDRYAQRLIFDVYGKVLHRIARRYLSDRAKVDDAVANAVYIVLVKISTCNFEAIGAFESWMKKIIVNECLAVLKKEKAFKMLDISELEEHYVDETILEDLTAERILEVISNMPAGYRIVFNMYEIEGYAHTEIAEMLGISLGTSKSQLSKAKAFLRKKIIELDPSYGKPGFVI